MSPVKRNPIQPVSGPDRLHRNGLLNRSQIQNRAPIRLRPARHRVSSDSVSAGRHRPRPDSREDPRMNHDIATLCKQNPYFDINLLNDFEQFIRQHPEFVPTEGADYNLTHPFESPLHPQHKKVGV